MMLKCEKKCKSKRPKKTIFPRTSDRAGLESPQSQSEPIIEDLLRLVYELQLDKAEILKQNQTLQEIRQELQDSLDHYADLYDLAPISYISLDDKGLIQESNSTAANILGVERSQLKAQPLTNYVLDRDIPVLQAHINQCKTGKEKIVSTLHLVLTDGNIIKVQLISVQSYNTEKGTFYYRTAIVDLTGSNPEIDKDQGLGQKCLELVPASACLNDSVKVEEVYHRVCDILHTTLDLRLVCIGLMEKDSFAIRPATFCGFENGFLSEVGFKWDNSPEGNLFPGQAIKTLKPVVINDISKNETYTISRDKALERGYHSAMAVPIIGEGSTVLSVLILYSDLINFFDEKKVKIIQEFALEADAALANHKFLEKLDDIQNSVIKSNTRLMQQHKKLNRAKRLANAIGKANFTFTTHLSDELETTLNDIIEFSDLLQAELFRQLSDNQHEYVKYIQCRGKQLKNIIHQIIGPANPERDKIDPEFSNFPLMHVRKRSLPLMQ